MADIMCTATGASAFFDYAKKRERIRVAREKGKPAPWTDDPILAEFRFCNVFREDDKVTAWLRENVREQLPHEQLLAATVLFRWFNRIEIGEVVFRQLELFDEKLTPWELYWKGGCKNTLILKRAIKQAFPNGPYVTGAYIIKGQDGMPKLDGVLHSFQQFIDGEATPGDADSPVDWRQMTQTMKDYPGEVYMQYTWDWLRQFNYLGPFMAYEIVTDLQHTLDMLHAAPDIMDWANPGPGAMRGLNRIAGRRLHSRANNREMIQEMKALLAASMSKRNWTWQDRPWDMRTVEHTLCEFDKWQRAMLGQGRPRQKYRVS